MPLDPEPSQASSQSPDAQSTPSSDGNSAGQPFNDQSSNGFTQQHSSTPSENQDKGLDARAGELTDKSPPSEPEVASERSPQALAGSASVAPPRDITRMSPPGGLIVLLALAIMGVGFLVSSVWIAAAGAVVALLVSLRISWATIQPILTDLISPRQRSLTIALVGALLSIIGLSQLTGVNQRLRTWLGTVNWDAVGALGEIFGAVGQILIAVLAVYVAWRQYVISKDLTIQQNLITQQQTIDSYFQGISDLVLDAEGLLEDWPQERAIAEGRTAAILSSVDAPGKAKVIRFLSRSRLLTPLKRDRHLGRAMLDGMGGYQEDRDFGIRVIDLGVMLAASNMAGTDLRWTDLSDANLVRANLTRCDLVKANLARTILYGTNLRGADLMGARLFYGSVETATPRTRADIPNYATGEFTGTVVEDADFTGVQRLSEQQRQYLCAWGGSKTRATIPGGCEGIPNRLGR